MPDPDVPSDQLPVPPEPAEAQPAKPEDPALKALIDRNFLSYASYVIRD
ncbi:MAG: hypothetical protein JSR82_07920, partial [Verrucomicrobia bacterium]|nr:hypothetical protein [Verrucomicrobiota bacterium]